MKSALFFKLFLILGLVLVILFLGYYFSIPTQKSISPSNNVSPENTPQSQPTVPTEIPISTIPENKIVKPFVSPISQAETRITKKPFGIYVTPQNSPVQPEKFIGYHTGTDFESLPNEATIDVPIKAICDGQIVQKGRVNGYGGVIIESCALEGKAITVLYGHLRLSDSPVKIGEKISVGSQLAFLGAGYSTDTDGERKHLHLSIHQGNKIEYRGYVQKQTELAGWNNPVDYIDFGK